MRCIAPHQSAPLRSAASFSQGKPGVLPRQYGTRKNCGESVLPCKLRMQGFLPQILNPWITKTGGTDENPEYKITGTARVLVKCKLVDTVSNVQLWPGQGSQTAWVGVSLVGEPKDISGKTEQVWKQGKRYVYTLIFGEGGGFNPDPDPDPENPDPEPVLVPITFNVTVDNFVEYPQDLDAGVPDSNPGK